MEHVAKLEILRSLRQIRDFGRRLVEECSHLEQLLQDPADKSELRGLRQGSRAFMAYELLQDARARTAGDLLEEMGIEPTAEAKRNLRKTLRAYAQQKRYFEEFAYPDEGDPWWYTTYCEPTKSQPQRKRRRRRRRKPVAG